MQLLFEYSNQILVSNPARLKEYLYSVWQQNYDSKDISIAESTNAEQPDKNPQHQPFLTFDGTLVHANNYVGFIQFENNHLEIYPKVFKCETTPAPLMLRHLFFWFSYCRKWKLPFTKSSLSTSESLDLPEMIINVMANTLFNTVSSQPISLYHSIEETLLKPKGKINFSKYLSKGFINANHHHVDCDYEPFIFDNKLNRTIKFTCRLLLQRTKLYENQEILQRIIFILDEVDDQPCTHIELETIILNPLFSDYSEVKDICKYVIQQLMYSNEQYEFSQWCLLFPMEHIFEDFIAGFLETHFSAEWKVEYQKSNLNLSVMPQAFQMQHDIFLTSKKDPSRAIIIDTKYKLRDRNFKRDKKKGVVQSDMYQMVTYALRRGCKEVIILYPNVGEELNTPDNFKVQSGFCNADMISVTTAEVPFWSVGNFVSLQKNLKKSLESLLR
jgi:5-methylcytosine-specific restriction enzyme subunit McrC